MHEMAHAYAVSITIPAVSDNGQFMIGKFYSGCHRQNPAMNPLKAVDIKILGRFSGAPDSRNDAGIMPFQTGFRDGSLNSGQYPEISAPGTPLDFGFGF